MRLTAASFIAFGALALGAPSAVHAGSPAIACDMPGAVTGTAADGGPSGQTSIDTQVVCSGVQAAVVGPSFAGKSPPGSDQRVEKMLIGGGVFTGAGAALALVALARRREPVGG